MNAGLRFLYLQILKYNWKITNCARCADGYKIAVVPPPGKPYIAHEVYLFDRELANEYAAFRTTPINA